MQNTEPIIDARPGRAAQVVPIEPTLLSWRRGLIVCSLLLPLYGLNLSCVFSAGLANYSLFNLVAFFYLVGSASYLFSRARWSVLNKRRQQVARYNLTVGWSAPVVAQSQPDLPALPETFALDTRPRWRAILLLAIGFCFFVGVASTLVYSYGQDMLQATRHGVPIALVVVEIGLNSIVPLLLIAGLCRMLIPFPRQQLSATLDGLTYRRGSHVSHIPWSEARLFAIIGQVSPEHGPTYYELASQHTLLRWPSHVGSWTTRQPPAAVWLSRASLVQPTSGADFPQQVQLLNIIIAERTGLPLYDLS